MTFWQMNVEPPYLSLGGISRDLGSFSLFFSDHTQGSQCLFCEKGTRTEQHNQGEVYYNMPDNSWITTVHLLVTLLNLKSEIRFARFLAVLQ